MKSKKIRIFAVLLVLVCVVAILAIALFFSEPNDEDSVHEYFKMHLESKHLSTMLYVEIANDASDRSDLPDMEDSLGTGRQRQSESMGILWLMQGIGYAEAMRYDKALTAVDAALEHWPTYVEAFAFKVHCLCMLQETNQVVTLQQWYQQHEGEMSNRERSLVSVAFGMVNADSREAPQDSKDPYLCWLREQNARSKSVFGGISPQVSRKQPEQPAGIEIGPAAGSD